MDWSSSYAYLLLGMHVAGLYLLPLPLRMPRPRPPPRPPLPPRALPFPPPVRSLLLNCTSLISDRGTYRTPLRVALPSIFVSVRTFLRSSDLSCSPPLTVDRRALLPASRAKSAAAASCLRCFLRSSTSCLYGRFWSFAARPPSTCEPSSSTARAILRNSAESSSGSPALRAPFPPLSSFPAASPWWILEELLEKKLFLSCREGALRPVAEAGGSRTAGFCAGFGGGRSRSFTFCAACACVRSVDTSSRCISASSGIADGHADRPLGKTHVNAP
eukprot:scaffold2343_cov25-Tisochrysis_lutea.AAC.1